MISHGVSVQEQPTSISSPTVVPVSIPFVVGAAPVQSATSPAAVGVPVLCRDWNEAVAKLGYSDDWKNYNLCEVMYSHFKLYGKSPVIFCNLLNAETMKTIVSAEDVAVSDNRATLPQEAISDNTLVVKEVGGIGDALVKGEDYVAFYSGSALVIELLSAGAVYGVDKINVAYTKVTPESVVHDTVSVGLESIEMCLAHTGLIPDLICAPGFSKNATVAAIMTLKAQGLFKAKALIDIDTATGVGARKFDEVAAIKAKNNITSKNQIACWPMLGNDGKVFHFSTHLAGVMATVDSSNNGIPYESPSNEQLMADCIILEDGTPVPISHAQANIVESFGVVTALNFINGLTTWGNFTACYPQSKDVKDYFIPIRRMFDWIGNTFIRTHWRSLDKPQIPRLIDSIVDGSNIWLNGLIGGAYLLGGRIVFRPEENPHERLVAGLIRVHIFLTVPPPLMEIEFMLEYDFSPFMQLEA